MNPAAPVMRTFILTLGVEIFRSEEGDELNWGAVGKFE